MNRRADLLARFDEKLPINQFQPFPHAGEADSTALDCIFGVEAKTLISHHQVLDAQECDVNLSFKDV